MKNIIKGIGIFFLLLFILTITFFSLLLFAANSSSNNWFNVNFREKFSQNVITRILFNLHRQGDAKSDYLNNDKYKKLIVEIDEGSYCNFSNNALKNIKYKMSNILDKPEGVEIIKSDVIESTNLSYNQKEIGKLAKEYKNYKFKNSTVVFYILCLNRLTDEPQKLSMTIKEDGMVIYWMALKDRKQIDVENFDKLVESTILFQFARQLGLATIDRPNCLISSVLKAQGNVKITSEEVISGFCPEELSEIENIRNSLK